MASLFRAAVQLCIAWLAVLASATGCLDTNNYDPGVPTMDGGDMDGGDMDGGDMDGGDMDGGDMDGGDMDGGDMDGGDMDCDGGPAYCVLPDGGFMPGTMRIPRGAMLLGISTSPGKVGLFAMPHSSSPDASIQTLAFSEMHLPDMSVIGVDPGTPVSIATDSKRRLISIVSRATPRVILWQPYEQMSPGDIIVGSGNQTLVGRGVLAPDGRHIYVANISQNRLEVLDLDGRGLSYEVTATTLPSLVKPNWITQICPGRLAVGSSSSAQNEIMVFNDDGGSLAYDSALSGTLIDGNSDGGRPGPCVTVPGQSYLFCVSGNYVAQPDADAGVDGGIEGQLWKWTPGASPIFLATTPVQATMLAIAPGGQHLYLAEGDQLAVYWVANSASDSPLLLTAISTGTAIYDVVPSPDGELVYVSVPLSNRLYIIRAADLSVITQRTDLSGPGPLFFSPGL